MVVEITRGWNGLVGWLIGWLVRVQVGNPRDSGNFYFHFDFDCNGDEKLHGHVEGSN